MSKYTYAKEGINQALAAGQAAGIDPHDILSALIVQCVDTMQHQVGKDETRVLLTYELDNLGGTLDMVNLRAR
jgi:hypothetical protein